MSGAPPTVAVLGTGTMGTPIARRLLDAGFSVRVWNRTQARAQPLAAHGAHVTTSPSEAADGAGVVLTMLSDGDAIEQAMLGPAGALAAMHPEAIWLQMSTIGPRWTDHFVTVALRHDVELVDAPVSGSDGPARAGELIVLASGSDRAHERLQPLLEAIGRRTLWLGAAGAGSRLKLVINNWLVCLVEVAAETLALADGLDLDEQLFVDAIAGGPLAAPYAIAKSNAMIKGDHAPGFPLRHALKDVGLTLSAARAADVEMTLTAALAPRWRRVADDGHADQDVSVVIVGLSHP
jgi:3-hydroxyisobutyrate dehydrogenase